MPDYRVAWESTFDGKPLYKAALTSYGCRDAGAGAIYNPIYRMVANMLDRAAANVGINRELRHMATETSWRRSVMIEWFRVNRERFQFTVEMHTADTDTDVPLIQLNNERIIDKLRRKWPTLSWEPALYNDGFAGVQAHGARVTGDYAVLQAFYWFIILQRATHADYTFCKDRGGQWKDVNKLIERHAVPGGVMYHNWPWASAWQNLRNGTAPDYVTAWSVRYGPILAEQNRATFNVWNQQLDVNRAGINELLSVLVPLTEDAKYTRW